MSQQASNCPFMRYCPIALGGNGGSALPIMYQPQRVVRAPRVSVSDIIFYIFLGLWVLFIVFAFMESNSIFDEFLQCPYFEQKRQPVQLKIYVSEPLQIPLFKQFKTSDSESKESESDSDAKDDEAKDNEDIPPLVSDSDSDLSEAESEAVVSDSEGDAGKAKSE